MSARVNASQVVDEDIDDLLEQALRGSEENRRNSVVVRNRKKKDEKTKMLEEQEKLSPWHGYCDKGELILKSGNVDKRRVSFCLLSGLFAPPHPTQTASCVDGTTRAQQGCGKDQRCIWSHGLNDAFGRTVFVGARRAKL